MQIRKGLHGEENERMKGYDRGCYCRECKHWSGFIGQGIGFCLMNINPDNSIRRVTTAIDFCSLGEKKDMGGEAWEEKM